MQNTICQAIQRRNLLSFNYDGLHRITEPRLLGESKTGKTLLSCYQIDGEVKPGEDFGRRLMNIDKIENLEVLSSAFDTSTAQEKNYNSNDSRMIRIICNV